MSVLSWFDTPPAANLMTICEQHGQLIVSETETPTDAYFSLDFSSGSNHQSTQQTARSAFLVHSDSWRKQLLQAWYEHGACGVLEFFVDHRISGKLGRSLGAVAHLLLTVLRFSSSIQTTLSPHLSMSSDELAAQFSSNPSWRLAEIRHLAWHPHTEKFAVVLHDDSIQVHNLMRMEIIPILKHRLQNNVTFVTWRPCLSSMLAVACQSCILLWTIEPLSLASRPSASCAQVLQTKGHVSISSLAWNPSGSLLASSSPVDNRIRVWDPSTKECSALRSGCAFRLAWSPDSSKLFALSPRAVLQVWDAQQWTCERWTNLSGPCRAACWSPDGSMLIFATDDVSVIFCLTFSQDYDGSVKGAKVAVSISDVSAVDVTVPEGSLRVGGTIQNLSWDPSGQRLAVQFQGSSGLIALFCVRLKPILELVPCGFLKGRSGEVPLLVEFKKNFKKGALLSVVWSSGRTSTIPLIFPTDFNATNDEIPMPISSNLFYPSLEKS